MSAPGTPPDDPLEAGLRIGGALERSQIPYALGGALAYGLWGVPRATVDVDVNVFVDEGRLEEVFSALESLGIGVDRPRVRGEATSRGMFVLQYGLFRVDVFVPSIAFAWEAARTRHRHEIDGVAVWFLNAEAIAVFKLLFFRSKDLVDLERLVAVQAGKLDVAYVRSHVAAMMGEDDPRIAAWDRIVAAGAGPR